MPRDGTGQYNLPNSAVVTATAISSTDENTTRSDMATALTNSIAKDGQTVPTANLPMGGYKHTGVADGVNATDYASMTQAKVVGEGCDFWGTTLPAKHVWANGAAISRTTYALLFAVLGTTYGVGDGVTTFNVPDKRGRVSVPKDDLGGVSSAARVSSVLSSTTLGASGGDQNLQAHIHTASDSGHGHTTNNPAHSHGITDPTHTHTSGTTVFQATGATGVSSTPAAIATDYVVPIIQPAATGITINNTTTSISVNTGAANITVTSTGAGNAQNVQPAIICNYIIYAGA